ncbi:MAG: J domain-containing protein [Kiloniellales bacterium]|nr:J domain-containing protein [Kiloniellales bacterium]
MKDPYQVLGVDRKASAEEIKSAYRKLAKKLHPDLNPEDQAIEQRFKEVSQAYALLSDPATRARFDRGEIDASGQERAAGGFHRTYRSAGGRQRGAPFDFGEEISVDDIFSEFFGGGRMRGGRRRASERGDDNHFSVEVSFEEAALGAKKRVRLGGGKTIEIKIPAGTESGQTLRLKGQGQAGRGSGQAGDALIEVAVAPHAVFRREGLDIHLDLPVGLQEAVLGAEVTVPTLSGKVTMKIPEGSNTGSVLRLKGKGIRAEGKTGDQYLTLKIVLPERQDDQLRDFVKRWAGFNAFDPRKKAGFD